MHCNWCGLPRVRVTKSISQLAWPIEATITVAAGAGEVGSPTNGLCCAARRIGCAHAAAVCAPALTIAVIYSALPLSSILTSPKWTSHPASSATATSTLAATAIGDNKISTEYSRTPRNFATAYGCFLSKWMTISVAHKTSVIIRPRAALLSNTGVPARHHCRRRQRCCLVGTKGKKRRKKTASSRPFSRTKILNHYSLGSPR